MKRNILAVAAIASALTSGFVHAEKVTVQGGKVNFEGSVVNSACAVESLGTNVSMGQVRVKDFKAAGDKTTPVEFEIKLTGCDSSITGGENATAAISFDGVSVAGKENVLALTGNKSAKGIGISISDSQGKAVTLDKKQGSAVSLDNGDNMLKFRANYVATDSIVTAGTANSSVNFSVTYE